MPRWNVRKKSSVSKNKEKKERRIMSRKNGNMLIKALMVLEGIEHTQIINILNIINIITQF